MLVPDPVDPNGIYAVAYTQIYHSTDAGATWNSSTTGLPLGGGAVVNTLAVDPKTPATLYAGLYSGVSVPALIYKSNNSGISWSPSGTGLPNTLGVFDLAVDPVNSANVYASLVASSTVNGGIFKSVDNGGSWQNTTSGIEPADQELFRPRLRKHPLCGQPTQLSLSVFDQRQQYSN